MKTRDCASWKIFEVDNKEVASLYFLRIIIISLSSLREKEKVLANGLHRYQNNYSYSPKLSLSLRSILK